METFAQLLIKKSAKKRKIEEEEYLEDADVFFPATGGDDEEAVGVVTMEFCKLLRTVRKKQKIPNRDREEQKSFGVMDMRLGQMRSSKDSLRMDRGTF